MKRIVPSVVLIALVACSALNAATTSSQTVTVSFADVVLLAQSDISDQTILKFLESHVLDFTLDAKGLRRLREAGVSENVIQYLLERDPAPIAVVPTYTTPTRYRTGYPSYYYGSRRALFPLGWYDHHYLGYGRTSFYGYAPHYNLSHNVGHSFNIRGDHHRGALHAPALLGGHRIGVGHSIGHQSSSLGHSSRRGGGHSRGHGGGHSRGHGGGHSGGHGGGHGSGH